MLVDDSVVVRGMVSRWLQEAGGVEIVGVAVDGQHALKKLAECDPDVCILDIEMPVMSGLEALPRLLALRPRMRVIMASTLSERGAAVTLKALELGAADFLPKPTAQRLGGAEDYRRDLVEKVMALGRDRAPATPTPKSTSPQAASLQPAPLQVRRAAPVAMRRRAEALVIASSTGGPAALRRLIEGLPPGWTAPILIAQHMPADFTPALAKMLAAVTTRRVAEGQPGETLQSNRVYVAPGNHHMTVRRSAAGTPFLRLDQEPPINWCRPSADPLFASAAEVWGGAVVGVVLTGMGHDGRDGARQLVSAGAPLIAQDEASSVVWGMPGAVVEAGLARTVLPLDEIAGCLGALA